MAKRTYMSGVWVFEITLRGNPAGSYSSWTVENVREGGRDILIPGMDGIASSDEGTAFSRACDRIDEWLRSSRKDRA